MPTSRNALLLIAAVSIALVGAAMGRRLVRDPDPGAGLGAGAPRTLMLIAA
jgi:hypothetical protein